MSTLQSKSFAHDGLSFEYTDSGPADGEVVVLLHGFPQDRTSWDAIIPALNQAGYRTVALDQRGYSPGARPGSVSGYGWKKTAGDVIALLDEVGAARAHVVGHDWGGSVAWCVASEWPDRVASLTVLSTPHPGAISAVAFSSTQLVKSWYMGLFQVPKVSEKLLSPGKPGWGALMRGLPAERVKHYTERMSQPGALSAALNWYRVLPHELSHPSLKVRRVSVPTAYIWGSRDPALGRAAAEATSKFVVGPYRFVALVGAGHWLPEKNSEAVLGELIPHLRAIRA